MQIRMLDLNNKEEILLTQPERTRVEDDGFRYGLFFKKQPMACAEQTDVVYRVNEGELWLQMAAGGHAGSSRFEVNAQEIHQKLGEQVGESMTCYVSAGKAFLLTCNDVTYRCTRDQMVVICLAPGEYQSVAISAQVPTQVLRINCMMLNPHDFSREIGVEMLKSEEGYAQGRLKLTEAHRGVNSCVDSGVLFTLADEMCGQAAATVGGICTTMNCTIEYIRMPLIGEYVYGEAFPIKMGRTIRNYRAYIRNEKNELICLTDAIFFNLQK